MMTEEGFKVRVAMLRKEEDALSREKDRLERDKVMRSARLMARRLRSHCTPCARRPGICAKSSGFGTKTCHGSARCVF
jgi:hypothetical protein